MKDVFPLSKHSRNGGVPPVRVMLKRRRISAEGVKIDNIDRK